MAELFGIPVEQSTQELFGVPIEEEQERTVYFGDNGR